jgi:hypothetical protein
MRILSEFKLQGLVYSQTESCFLGNGNLNYIRIVTKTDQKRMAKASLELVSVLRKTAAKISNSSDYQWGHMGACNCGFLAQEITQLPKMEIHLRAMQGLGDWNEQLNDYCPTSGLPMDDLISKLLKVGFDVDDLKHLERLSSPEILRQLPIDQRNLKHNVKSDVVKYLRVWAALLEEKLVKNVSLGSLTSSKLVKFNA